MLGAKLEMQRQVILILTNISVAMGVFLSSFFLLFFLDNVSLITLTCQSQKYSQKDTRPCAINKCASINSKLQYLRQLLRHLNFC